MKKVYITLTILALFACGIATAGSSGVSDPSVTYTKSSPTGGFDMRKQIANTVESIADAVDDVIDVADGIIDGTTSITASNYALLTQVWGAATITSTTNVKESVATITANDIAGSAVAGLRLLRIWASETDGGAVSTNNIETLVLTTGTAVSTETANADYYYVTAAAGTAVATVTGTAAGTNYLMVADGSTVSSGAIVFE